MTPSHLSSDSREQRFAEAVRDAVRGEPCTAPAELRQDARARMQQAIETGAGARTVAGLRDLSRVAADSRDLRHIRRDGVRRSFVPFGMQRWVAVAACAGVAIVAGFVTTRAPWPGAGRTGARSYSTAVGERATVPLANGGTMLLGGATRVRVTDAGIDVDGEALFKVRPQADRPLIVRTANAVVQVLGTTFSVRHYASDGASRIEVADGRVVVQGIGARRTRAVLSAQMRADVRDSGVAVTPKASVREYADWVEGRLVFRDVQVREVVADLARAYGVEIRVTDTTLARESVTLTAVVKTQRLDEVLALMTRTVDAHVSRVGKVFVLAPGRGPAPPARTPRPSLHTPSEVQYGR